MAEVIYNNQVYLNPSDLGYIIDVDDLEYEGDSAGIHIILPNDSVFKSYYEDRMIPDVLIATKSGSEIGDRTVYVKISSIDSSVGFSSDGAEFIVSGSLLGANENISVLLKTSKVSDQWYYSLLALQAGGR